MDTVVFINASTSKKSDLLLSFAIADSRWPGGIRSLILLRCPKTELVFEEDERGISVSMEGDDDDKSDIKGHLLTEFTFDSSAKTVRVKTPNDTYDLDIRKVKPDQIVKMHENITKMNLDKKATIVGL